MFGMMIDADPKFYVVRSPTAYMTLSKFKVTDFLYWSFVFKFLQYLLCLSFYNICFVKVLMDWFMFGMMIETGPEFYMVLFQTQYRPVGQGHRLFAKPSLDF